MGRKGDTLKHQLRVAAFAGITDNDSRRGYRRACDCFSQWAKEQGIRQLADVTRDVIQQYERHLEARPEGYTAATIHSRLAPVCKAAGVSMREIRKPKRTAARIVRGRSETKTGRGEREKEDPRFARLVMLQQCIGIRRSELARLKGRDLVTDDHGGLYVLVERGKGGKSTLQFVLPADRDIVREIFKDVGPDELVFSADEMLNHINLHGMRSDTAKRAYAHYCGVLQRSPKAADHLRGVLLRRWEDGHVKLRESNPKAYSKARDRFTADMDDRPYLLRGENKLKAEARGLPTEYNRLALMLTSVLHLSHWRLDVSSVNYMVQ